MTAEEVVINNGPIRTRKCMEKVRHSINESKSHLKVEKKKALLEFYLFSFSPKSLRTHFLPSSI